ncbi:ankyrin repeat protein [Colletotrichum truncatum]|uniref:Ankyrin repeat protein n=1 Tax=Colletotrichum truncatum TaxID=5467 RepID=A0ACC3YVE4_COLTU|nr:ankyrin repeat protein [Colletotrichum truncatum]KAF6781568.1 ankyrin repeat protein [Colletotrichum truncatum]
MAMPSFSSAAVTSSCDNITHRAVSTSAELDTLLKGIDPGTLAAQHLISLSGKLDRFKRTTEQLRQSLTSASTVSPGLRNALNISIQPCADSAAIVDKQIRRLDTGNVTRLNPEVITLYEDYYMANTRLFTQFTQVLQIPTLAEQDLRLSAPDGHQLLEKAAEVSQIILSRNDILGNSNEAGHSGIDLAALDGEQTDTQPHELPPDYVPETQDKGKKKATGLFSSLSNSFKAMTAGLRPKPEPMVIAMCQAATDGDVGLLKGFVSQGININGQNEQGYTPLICAIRADQLSAVEFLISAGVDKTVKDSASGKRKPPLFHAAELGFVPIADYLIRKGADTKERSWSGQPYFIEVANSDQLDIIKLFLSRGCDANMVAISGRSIFTHAIQNGSLPHIKLLQEYGADINTRDAHTGQSGLHVALGQNRLDIVSWLLEHGANPNVSDYTGTTLLISALHKKQYELAKLLLTRGADPNSTGLMGKGVLWQMLQNKDMDDGTRADLVSALLEKGADPNQTDNWGESIMSQVITLGNTELLRTFLAHGGNANKKVKEDTFLLYAIDRGRYEHAKMLLKHGADVNAPDNKGRVPLIEALQMDSMPFVELLLQFGADPNKTGQIKPLALARLLGNPELIQALAERGAEAPKRHVHERTPTSPATPSSPASATRTNVASAQSRAEPRRSDVPPPYTEAGGLK